MKKAGEANDAADFSSGGGAAKNIAVLDHLLLAQTPRRRRLSPLPRHIFHVWPDFMKIWRHRIPGRAKLLPLGDRAQNKAMKIIMNVYSQGL